MIGILPKFSFKLWLINKKYQFHLRCFMELINIVLYINLMLDPLICPHQAIEQHSIKMARIKHNLLCANDTLFYDTYKYSKLNLEPV